MKHWYEDPLRVFDVALEDPYGQWLDRWTAKDLVALVRKIHANVLDMMIVNEWGQAYFTARHLPQHPQLNGSDRLAEVLEEARKNDIRMLGMWGPTPNPILYERHPDWAKRSVDGEISGWGYLHLDPCIHVCHNSPYGDIVLETLNELFEGYPIDGVAFDYFIGRPCYCRYCRDKFLRKCGLDIHAKENWIKQEDRKFSDWATQDSEDFVRRAAQVAHQHGRILVGWLRSSDVIFAEPHTGGMITIKDKGFLIRKTRARSRVEKKPTVICTPYSHLYYVGLSKPPQHMRQEFREIVISDASPWPVIWDWECVRDTRGLSAIGKIFEEVKDHEAYLRDRTSFKYAALLISDQTSSLLGDEAYRHIDPAKGWYDALVRAHLPVDVILDEEITPQCLFEYRILVLANAQCLSDHQVEGIREFVSQGGGLVASHRTSLYDGDGYFRRGFALKDVVGCEFQAVIDDPWTYIGFSGKHPVNEGFERDFLVMHGEMRSLEGHLNPDQSDMRLRGITHEASHQLKVAPIGSSQILGTIFDSAKPLGSYFRKDLSPAIPGKDTGYPAIIMNTYGKGHVVYFSGQVDRLFYRIGHPDYERLLLNSLYCAGGKPAITIKAPTTVEATFFQQREHKRIIIHLLNHTYDQLFPAPTTGSYGSFSRDVFRPVGDILPVSGIQVSLQILDDGEVKKIFSLSTLKEVPYRLEEGAIHFRVSRLDEYDAFVVEYA
ncbi:MAG: beta-galactosidase trimerization domain-containing protein [Candidatus Latescibacteria bacterium]|nr:beta-galactosidase trimerization domain-containing protein [Candidatus Latescibacterota bacterium]